MRFFRLYVLTVILAVGTIIVPIQAAGDTKIALPLLAVLSAFMLAQEWSSGRFALFVTAFCLGPISEIISIEANLWSYTSSDVLGIPLWLPFVWGNAAVFIVRTEQFLRGPRL